MEELIRKVLGVLATPSSIEVHAVAGATAPIAAVPEGVTLVDLSSLMDVPARISGCTNLREYPSFTRYVLEYKEPGSRIFVSPDLTFQKSEQLAVCYLDFPEPSVPQWSQHSVCLLVQPSLEYRKLMDLDGKLLPQDDFARRLRDVSRFCTSLPAADLLEIASRLTLTSKGDFRSFSDDISGAVSLGYDVKVRASVSGTSPATLEVPTNLTFELPLLMGGRSVTVNAELLYRIPEEAGGKITMGIRLPDRLYDERDLLQELVKSIEFDTGVVTAVGDSSVPERQAIKI